ncbi:hypothetical protein JTE90_009054 [Oedothorax gibbosus]|uniref:C2H2-type domain-containing protein n=1 Tax=Oedothorax gibbosus TaxID=931172 RepID=A0AAV6VI31_9ARAC|nr:hypothetical protein JTE90_009054 [Oedothorax gibbosus]
MPDKEESFLTENVSAECDYQDLSLPKKSLSEGDMEEGVMPSCHTAFPVDLKEVFELTNPNNEIHHTLMRSSSGDLGYPHSPKDDSNEVTWRHVLRDHGTRETSPERHSTSWDMEEPVNDGVISDSGGILRHPTKSVITVPESWTHVVKQVIPEGGKISKNDSHVTVISVPESWRHLVKQEKIEKVLSNGDNNQAWSHILEPTELSHSVVVMDQDKGWSHLLDNDHPSPHQDIPPIDLSGDCTKLTSLIPERRDVSCQADDVTDDVQQLDEDPELKGNEEHRDGLMSFDDGQESNQAVVHDGIKPELYTQERHLVVQAGTKAAGAKTATTYSCGHCTKVFGDSRSLQRHTLVHSNLRQYRCPVCSKSFTLNGDLTRHVRIHSGERPYACEVCGRRFTLKGNLMQHFRTHAPEKQFACTICEKNYAQRDSLHRHIRAHFGERPFECPTCSKRFTLKGDLSRHVLIHSGVKPHACKYCGRQFALKGNLTQHVRTHIRKSDTTDPQDDKNQGDEQPLICDLSYPQKSYEQMPHDDRSPESPISYTPTTPAYIQTNENNNNEGDNNNSTLGLSFCSECSKTFPSPEALHSHVRLIHEQSTRLNTNRYLCNICRKEFSLKGDLTRHLDSHNGVKPYACEHCGKSFTLKSNLRQHLTTHRQDRSFACPMCSKTFGNRRNLSLHLRRHEQARANFTCTRCGRSFLAKSDHFFHNCADPNATGTSPIASTDTNTPPDSPQQHISPLPDPNLPPEEIETVVKRESCQLPCDDILSSEDDPESSIVGQSFLGPFYRHLYFSTSHQSVIPTLKGLLNVSGGRPRIVDSRLVVSGTILPAFVLFHISPVGYTDSERTVECVE